MLNNPFYNSVRDGSVDVSDVEGYTPAEFQQVLEETLKGTENAGNVVAYHDPDLDDVFQNTVLKSLEKAEKVKAAETLSSYVRSIPHHEAINLLKSQRDWKGTTAELTRVPLDDAQNELPVVEKDNIEADPERLSVINEILDVIRDEFHEKSKVLEYQHDPDAPKSARQTARDLSIKESSVHYARREVRGHLRDVYEDERRWLFGPHHSKRR